MTVLVLNMCKSVGFVLALSLLANAFCLPVMRPRRQSDNTDNSIAGSSDVSSSTVNYDLPPPIPFNDDADDDFPTRYPSDGGGGGSNVFSLLRLASGLIPGLSSGSSSSSKFFKVLINEIMKRTKSKVVIRRNDLENEIDIDYISDLKPPPLQKQEEKSTENSESNSNESGNGGEESLEADEETKSKEDSDSNLDDDDYDEPPGGGDGEGGGLLGLLAGLSGGEDGQSDLGSLLATIGGIVANLSGDGIDLNALIASGIGLFVGLLSEGEENPGAVIASYLLTSLDTVTGGGANNNGAFFGKFLSKLVKGTSAAGDPDASSEENGDKPPMADSAGFFLSFLTSLLGDMSKGSSGSHPWRRIEMPSLK